MILPVSLKSPIIISDSLATQKLYNFLLISACCVHWIKRPKAFRYFAIAHTSWVAACERIAIFNDLLGVICVRCGKISRWRNSSGNWLRRESYHGRKFFPPKKVQKKSSKIPKPRNWILEMKYLILEFFMRI